MPLMEKDQTHVCVVCPVVRGEIKTSGKEIRQEPEPEVKPGKFLIADEGLRTEKLLFADPRTLPHVAYSEKLNNESNQGKIMMATNKDTLFKVIEAPVASFFAGVELLAGFAKSFPRENLELVPKVLLFTFGVFASSKLYILPLQLFTAA